MANGSTPYLLKVIFQLSVLRKESASIKKNLHSTKMEFLTLSLWLNSSFDDEALKSFALQTLHSNLVEFRSVLFKIRALVNEWIKESGTAQEIVSNC